VQVYHSRSACDAAVLGSRAIAPSRLPPQCAGGLRTTSDRKFLKRRKRLPAQPQNRPKSIKRAGTSLDLDCDMESHKTSRLDAHAPYDDGLSAFLGLRPRLFGIAYRMLGSAAEAEDIVQDVWVRWQTTDRSVVRNAAAFLVTTATRLAINVLQSARSRRETCVGPCPPETVDTTPDPRLRAEQGQALAVGVELLLERLTPTERAAYILREAFDYPYRDIANVLRLGEANARQVVTRARHHVASGPRMAAHSSEPGRLLEAFIVAAQQGEVDDLEGLLASDVVSISVRAAAA